MTNSEMIEIAVPVRHYAKVVQYLAELYAKEGEGNRLRADPVQSDLPSSEVDPGLTVGEAGFLSDVLGWNREEILTLRDSTSNASTIAIFELAKEREDGTANYRDVMARTGRTENQVRADLSGLGKTSSRRFKKASWPIQLEGTIPTDGVSKYAYRVPKQYLEWWFED